MIGQLAAPGALTQSSQLSKVYENSPADQQEDRAEVSQQDGSFPNDVTSFSPQSLALARNVPPVGNEAEANEAPAADTGMKEPALQSGQINVMA